MGKSVLLEDLAGRTGVPVVRTDRIEGATGSPLIWDVPAQLEQVALPESIIAGERRLILAKRLKHGSKGFIGRSPMGLPL